MNIIYNVLINEKIVKECYDWAEAKYVATVLAEQGWDLVHIDHMYQYGRSGWYTIGHFDVQGRWFGNTEVAGKATKLYEMRGISSSR